MKVGVAIRVFVAIGTLGAGGCVTNIRAGDGGAIVTYIGIVRLKMPNEATGAVTTMDAQTLGMRMEHGLGIGFFRDKRVSVPIDCRVVVFVQNTQQLDFAVKNINSVGARTCVAVNGS